MQGMGITHGAQSSVLSSQREVAHLLIKSSVGLGVGDGELASRSAVDVLESERKGLVRRQSGAQLRGRLEHLHGVVRQRTDERCCHTGGDAVEVPDARSAIFGGQGKGTGVGAGGEGDGGVAGVVPRHGDL